MAKKYSFECHQRLRVACKTLVLLQANTTKMARPKEKEVYYFSFVDFFFFSETEFVEMDGHDSLVITIT